MKKELNFFDKKENVQKFLRTFFVLLIVLLIIDFLIHKHPHFGWEGAPEFYAVYGFVSCVALIFIAKLLRLIVRRDEDYYDR
jgi:purine-cytosine permease-like protein